MKRWTKCSVLLFCALLLYGSQVARAQGNVNSRAKEDLNEFVKKVEEGDALFNQKKYAEAATSLAAAHASYLRAERRDSNAVATATKIRPQTFPALRHYGYISGPEGSLQGDMADPISENYAVLHNALLLMWRDASILGDVATAPLSYAFTDPPLVELTEERLLSVADEVYQPVRRLELPVPDRDWRDVVFAGRRAQLLIEHLLQKYPAWRTTTINWIGQPTGDEVMADIKKKLAEAEPEYQKLVADFQKTPPADFSASIRDDVKTLNQAIASVKRGGWLDWPMARDLFITNDYLALSRKNYPSMWTREGKTMPPGSLKPLDDKIAELKSAVDKNAPRWHFPTNKPRNAAIEARAAAGVKAKFPGATVLKTALDDADWRIEKNDIGLPRYRAHEVLVLTRIPGQKWPWLIVGTYTQTYAGGGTYSSVGSFAPPYYEVRLQAAQ